jgi:CMP-N-acetylneuraminic acid synthetase
MSSRGATLAVIPARGGSRGLPGKLLRSLGGIPVLAHTVRAASVAERIDHALVSTDDPRIRRTAIVGAPMRRSCGRLPSAATTHRRPL